MTATLVSCVKMFVCYISKCVWTYLQDGEVLEHAVHHVLLGQVLELVYEVDHVLAHGRAVDAVHEAAALEARVLRLHLLHHLLAERAHLRAARDRHVLVALVPAVGTSTSIGAYSENSIAEH